jgi:N6-adenosine-specific RNA methylase IME4
VGAVLADDAHLYLWVPNALLPGGLRVMEAWGFRYVSNVVWAKRRKDGGAGRAGGRLLLPQRHRDLSVIT